eukprot:637099-Pleurochrysis_carterae.AAC.2
MKHTCRASWHSGCCSKRETKRKSAAQNGITTNARGSHERKSTGAHGGAIRALRSVPLHCIHSVVR